jgi:CDP-diacylglycerol--serine O-phosphatidyltransferase
MESPIERLPARRGMYVLPSLFTAGNMAMGFYAMLEAIRGAALGDNESFDRAAVAIVLAVLSDGLDGRIARMTNTASAFGKELDSLADVVSFGVAPALLAYLWGVRMLVPSGYPLIQERVTHFGAVICFVFLICGACRLARFNISVNPVPRNPGRPDRKYFVGMPIPAGAGALASVIHLFEGSPVHDLWACLLWLSLVATAGFLMVSSWRFWSGKELDLSTRQPGRTLVFFVCLGAILFEWHRWVLFGMSMVYVVSGVVARIAYSAGKRSSSAAA